ncbi:MAG TPA: acetyltransferase [Fluviicoccus sp.]|nr:acetyltransferase [Fluviicoccus sp.]
MPTESAPIWLVGAGGHAKVVADAVLSANPERALGVRDDSAARQGAALLAGLLINGGSADVRPGDVCHVAIGDNAVRRRMTLELIGRGAAVSSVRHPAACVSAYAEIGEGSFIAAQAVVGPAAAVGRGVIVNHGAIIDHDCRVGDWCHVAPNATLGGGVRLGEGVLVGAGATVLPGLTIGDGAVIGAGAVVTRNVPDHVVAKGSPARWGKAK